MSEISALLGVTLTHAWNRDDEEVYFLSSDGRAFRQNHYQDCCESVTVESIVGDLDDLIGSPILQAEEVTYSGQDSDADNEWPPGVPVPEYREESYTWTFYKLATIKGCVTIRWFGGSNGDYSESVDFDEVPVANVPAPPAKEPAR